MLRVYKDPMVYDFLLVSQSATEDQKQQWEIMTGFAWDFESCALGMWQTQGPKWVIKNEAHEPVAVAGYNQERPNVWRDFLITTDEAWEPGNWQFLTREARKVGNAMFESGFAHRLECVSLASRIKAHRWYAAIGLTYEATLRKYCANGEDAMMFSRVRG